MVSELSESVANRSQAPATFDQFLLKPDGSKVHASTDGGKPNNPSSDDLFKELPDEEFFDEDWCDPSQPAKPLPCGMCDRDEGEKATKEEQTDVMIQTKGKLSSAQEEGYLEAFSMALNCDFTSMGRNISEIDWKTAVLGAFIVEDKELLQLMDIVSTEINKTPALEVEDAMESPTQLVIETARSFS